MKSWGAQWNAFIEGMITVTDIIQILMVGLRESCCDSRSQILGLHLIFVVSQEMPTNVE